MSAGAFVLTKYAASYGAGTSIHPIKIQPETLTLTLGTGTPVANAAPTGAQNNQISARVSGGKRTLGLIPRKVTVRFTGAVPAGYAPNSKTTIPWLTPFTAAITKGATGTYLGNAVIVVATSPEIAQ